jgi:hypothetical protein
MRNSNTEELRRGLHPRVTPENDAMRFAALTPPRHPWRSSGQIFADDHGIESMLDETVRIIVHNQIHQDVRFLPTVIQTTRLGL